MSDPDDDEREVTVDGIHVRHRLDFEQFPLPVASFRVKSERDEPARIHLRLPVPNGAPSDGVGFHNEYNGEYWAIDDGDVLFERPLDAGEVCETLFTTKSIEEGQEPILDEATIEVLAPDERLSDGQTTGGGNSFSMEDLVDSSADDSVRELIAGDRSSLPGMEDEDASPAAGESIAEAESVDASSLAANGDSASNGDSTGDDEPVEEPELTPPESDTSDDVDANLGSGGDKEPALADETGVTDSEAATAADGGVARVLLKELKSGYVSTEQRDALREELGVGEQQEQQAQASGQSADVRISHLESRVSELNAYTDALETFIDEEGAGQDLIKDLRGDTQNLESELRGVQETVNGIESEVSELQAVQERVNGIESEISELQAVQETVDGIESEINELQEEFERMEAFYKKMERLFSDSGSLGD